jgi:hypothetical protein
VPLQELVLGWQLQSQATILYFAVANAMLVLVKLRHSHSLVITAHEDVCKGPGRCNSVLQEHANFQFCQYFALQSFFICVKRPLPLFLLAVLQQVPQPRQAPPNSQPLPQQGQAPSQPQPQPKQGPLPRRP